MQNPIRAQKICFSSAVGGKPRTYEEDYSKSIDPDEREAFWREQAKGVHWFKPYDKVLDDSKAPLYRWFTGGLTNVSYNCIDRHVEQNRGENKALVYESAYTQEKEAFTYKRLQEKVGQFARVLAKQGVKKGDVVIIYMPMIPEALIAMHACVRLGAIHSVVFGGFAPDELANRINHCKPKVIVTASCGIEPNKIIPYVPNVDQALQKAGVPELTRIIVQRSVGRAEGLGPNYLDYETEMSKITQLHDVVPVEGDDPFFILYTSGTTGDPKGIYRSHGGQSVAYSYVMKYLFDLGYGDGILACSDIGWIVGHSYLIYAPLFAGGTTVMFEGKPVGTPDPGVLWRLVEEHKVKSVFIAPTAVRALKKDDHEGTFIQKYDTSSLKSIHLAGEHCDPATIHWLQNMFPERLINDNWWQTESGWAIASNYLKYKTFPVRAGSTTKPCPGWNVQILDDSNQQIQEADRIGKVVVKLPCPPGHMDGLWGNDEGYVEKYLNDPPGYYLTGDGGYFDKDGYLYIMTRTDDVMNVAGHRLSAGRIEEVLSEHKDVAECAVVGKNDKLKGVVPVAFVILQNEVDHKKLNKELQGLVREKIGAFGKLERLVFIQKLPKTRSGKILRNLLRDITNHKEEKKVTPTIEDRSVIEEIMSAYEKNFEI